MPRANETPRRIMRTNADIAAACLVAVVALVAALAVPSGQTVRLLLTLPVLLFAPGYLLIQAAVVGRPFRGAPLAHYFVAVGVSPPLVGLLGLFIAVTPLGFRPGSILATMTIACFLLGAVAVYRRSFRGVPSDVHVTEAASAL